MKIEWTFRNKTRGMNRIIKGEASSEFLEAGAQWNTKFTTREKRSEQRQMKSSIQRDRIFNRTMRKNIIVERVEKYILRNSAFSRVWEKCTHIANRKQFCKMHQ